LVEPFAAWLAACGPLALMALRRRQVTANGRRPNDRRLVTRAI